MSDKNYFPNGELFIKTRKRINADFLLYTPNGQRLSSSQKDRCNNNNIVVKEITQLSWDTTMQTMKFFYLLWDCEKYDNITFCDFDTFFINDWHEEVFRHDFILGITTTEGFPQWNYLRAKANGGVIFLKTGRGNDVKNEAAKDFLCFIIKCINHGNHIKLPEYDDIWKTLENPNRPPRKRHFRTNQKWWCDQVALSALVFD